VLAVSGKAVVWRHPRQRQVKAILAALPTAGWARISAGLGRKGPRWYDWLRFELRDPLHTGWKRWLVVRRSSSDPSAVTAYIAFAPVQTSLPALGRVAGMRWTVAESIQTAQGEVGLDHYEVRKWTGWDRHLTLARWAQAFLAVMRAETGVPGAPKKGPPHRPPTPRLAAFKAHRGLRSG
jgi:hypothetical protein